MSETEKKISESLFLIEKSINLKKIFQITNRDSNQRSVMRKMNTFEENCSSSYIEPHLQLVKTNRDETVFESHLLARGRFLEKVSGYCSIKFYTIAIVDVVTK